MSKKPLFIFFAISFVCFNLPQAHSFSGNSVATSNALSLEADPQTGSAGLGVPITIPSGRGGIQPNIQLNYNSNLPNGIFGVGWALELGAIKRWTKNGPPKYDSTDTYILMQNGSVQELVYDSVVGFYRTENEGSFMKIEKLSPHWVITDTKGVKYYFGEEDNSQAYDTDPSKVLKWCLNRVEDLQGNEMTIEYFKDKNKLYPADIYYTANNQTSMLPFAHVQFERELRPDAGVAQYISGYDITTDYRIAQINVYVEDTLQRRYELNYTQSNMTHRSLLTSVTQVGNDEFSTLPSSEFNYQDYTASPAPTYTITTLNNNVAGDNKWNFRNDGNYDRGHDNYGPCPPTNMCNSVSWSSSSLLGGGDGNVSFSSGPDTANWLSTFVYVNEGINLTLPYVTGGVDGGWLNGNYSQNVARSLSLKSGYNRIDLTFYHQHESFGFNLNYALANNVDLMSSTQQFYPQFSGDFNGDGLTDVGQYTPSSGKVEIALSQGSTFESKTIWHSNLTANSQVLSGNFDNDSILDIVVFNPSNGNWRVGLSTGSQFNDAGNWHSSFGTGEKPSTGDFNGDGLTDIVTFYMSSGELRPRYALNIGGSFQTWGGAAQGIDTADNTAFAADFNADGIADFGTFNKSSGTWRILANPGDLSASFPLIVTEPGFGIDKEMVVSDFNMDGLTDIGYYDHAAGKVTYKPLEATGFGSSRQVDFAFDGLTSPTTHVQAADFNGDGLADFMAFNDIGDAQIAYSDGDVPDLLLSFNNGAGSTTSLTYESSAKCNNTFLPFAMQTISTVTHSNNRGDVYTTNYSYSKGLWSAEDREFRGFGMVRTIDSDGNYSETDFLQDDTYKGRVSEQRSYGLGDHLFSKTVYTWSEPQDIASGSTFIYLERKDNFVYDGDNTGRRTAEEFFYDEPIQYGNLTKAVQLGEVELDDPGNDIPGDSRTVETTYVNNSSAWLLGLPVDVTVKDTDETIVRRTYFFYDNNLSSTDQILDKGLLTKKEDWAGDAPGVTNPVTQYTYDSTGNLLSTTDPLNNTTTIVYDTTYNIFPIVTTNALSHQVQNEYYGVNEVVEGGFTGLWGQLKATTDPNDETGKRVYDTFGRLSKTISPLDSIEFPTVTTEYQFSFDHNRTITRQRIEHGKPQTVDVHNYYDGFGRLIQTKTPTKTIGKYVVSSQSRYNSRGLTSEQYLPDFSTNSINAVDVLDTSKPHTTITYDAMGRVVETINPDGSRSNGEYDDWSTSTINANGHKQKSVFDAYGRLIQKIEYSGADGRADSIYPYADYTPYATTQYVYDSEGNLTNTIDAHNNTTTISYDNLGRKVSMNDPDMGIWTYSYDLNGNLKAQTDAKGNTIDFTYDTLNRLTNKTDQAQLNVNYTYDNDVADFSKGRLARAEYGSGNLDGTDFYYDAFGREITSVKSIGLGHYEVNRDYDARNSLVKVEYPDGKNIHYKYNVSGQIESVSNDETLFPEDVLSPPELDTIETSDSKVRLTWTSVSGAVEYTIHYGLSQGSYPSSIPVGNATTHIVDQLSNGTIYYFVVTATDAEDVASAYSNERSASPAALIPISVDPPIIQYTFNDNIANEVVIDTIGGYHAETTQDVFYTPDLANGGSASASSCLGGCGGGFGAYKSFDNVFNVVDGWVADNTKSGWLSYYLPSSKKVTKYLIYPRAGIPGNTDGANPKSWQFEGYNGSGWDALDTRNNISGWVYTSPKTFTFSNDQAYQEYRLNISENGGHVEVGLTEMEMMGFTPVNTKDIVTTGKVNLAFNFDTSYRVNIEDMIDAVKFHNMGSISFWIKSTSNGYFISTASSTSTTHCTIHVDGSLNITLKLDGALIMKARGSTDLTDGIWHHATIVQDGTSVKLYVDGVEDVLDVAQGDLTAWINDVNSLLDIHTIGGANNSDTGDVFFNGIMDDFRYYDYPLTPLEVGAIYNNGNGTEEESPQYLPPDPLASVESGDNQYSPGLSANSVDVLNTPRIQTTIIQDSTDQVVETVNLNEYDNRSTLIIDAKENKQKPALNISQRLVQTVDYSGSTKHTSIHPHAKDTLSKTIDVRDSTTVTTLNRLSNKTDSKQLDIKYAYDNNIANFPKRRLARAEYQNSNLDNVDFYYDAFGHKVTSYRVNAEDMADVAQLDNKGSISFWVKGTADGYVMATASSTNTTYYAVHLDGNLNITLKLDGAVVMNARGSKDLTNDSWHHAVIVQDGTSIKFYVDGVQDTLNLAQGDLTAWINDMNSLSDTHYIGGENSSDIGDVFFNGSIDDFRYYDYPLTPLEIETIYNNGEGTSEKQATNFLKTFQSSIISFYAKWIEPNIFGIFGTKEAYAGIAELLTIEIRVSSSSDDAEESSNRLMKLDSISLDLMEASINQIIYPSFPEIEISREAQLTNIYDKFNEGKVSAKPIDFEIRPDMFDNIPPFDLQDGDTIGRPIGDRGISDLTHGLENRGIISPFPDLEISREAQLTNIYDKFNGGVVSAEPIDFEIRPDMFENMPSLELQDGSTIGRPIGDRGVSDSAYGLKNQAVGMRFVGVQIPQGAQITNAYVQFKTDKKSIKSTHLEIRAEMSGNAVSFRQKVGDITNRLKTNSSVQWNPPAWSTIGEAGSNQRTPNIAGTIQEVIDRSDWVTGNSIAIIITGTGERRAKSYDGDSAGAPLLHIEYSQSNTSSGPNAPILNTPTVDGGDVDLSWNSVSNATGYKVKYGTASGVYGNPIDVGNVTNYSVSGLNNDVTYYFVVTAYNAVKTSDDSNEKTAILVTPTPLSPVLNTPTIDDGQVSLSWNTVAHATGYKVKISKSSGDYSASIDVGNVVTHSIDGLSNDVTYYFVVTAYNSAKESNNSNEETAILVTPTPSAPTLNTPTIDGEQVNLSWNAVANTTGYKVKYGTVSGIYGDPIDVGNVTNYSIDDLNKDTTYYFIVIAYNAVKTSNNSNEETAILVTPTPLAPILNEPTVDDQQVGLSWNSVADATGYKIKYGTESGSYGVPIDVGNVTNHLIDGLSNDVTYYFVVMAYNLAKESEDSNEETAILVTPTPSAPVLNTPIAGDGQVDLSWNAVVDATGYNVKYGTTSGVYGDPIDVGNITNHSVDGLNNDVTYYFAVTVYNATKESDNSNEESVTPMVAPQPPLAPILNTPIVGDEQVDLDWDIVDDTTGYKVRYGTASGVYGDPVDVGNVTSYTVTTLTNDVEYYFVVNATNAVGDGKNSNEESATPIALIPLSAPILNTPVADDGQIDLSWNIVTDATGYKVKYGTASGVYGTPIDVGNVTNHVVTDLSNDTTYYFVVTSYDAIEESADSNEESAILATPTPSAPTLNTPIVDGEQVNLSWNTVADATGYKVKYGTATGSYGAPVDVGNVTNHSVSGLSNDVMYYFVVTAYNVAKESDNSNEETVILVTPPPLPPVLDVPFASDGRVDLNWSVVADATGYKVKYGTEAGSYGAPVDVGNVVNHSVMGLTNDTEYYFAVVAYHGVGESVNSNEKSSTPFSGVADPQLFVTNVEYNASGQVTELTFGNGTVTTHTYNPLNLRLERVYTVDSLGGVIQDLNYTYDPVGNILSITDNVNTADQTFEYDEQNRLVEAVGETYGTKSYVYDEIGNIISKSDLSYTYGEGGAGPHAVTSLDDGTTFTYDENGNMATKQDSDLNLTEYIYDVENRLVEVEKGGLSIAQYEYDGDGGRTSKTTAGITTKYIGSLYEQDNRRATRHVFLGSQRIASITNGKVMYYHQDHLGGTNVLTDIDGELKELIEYEPFGTYARHEKYGTDFETSLFYFTGKKLDDETGLYYYEARYYDPDIGRFITPDTFVQAPSDSQSFNRYTYVRNNPVNLVDPTGHFFGFIFAIAKAVIAYAVEHAAAIAIGSVIGAGAAAATGGNIGLGALTGAIGGGIFGAIGGLQLGGLAQVGAHTAGGAATGAISAVITGGDPVKGALIGGLSAGITQGLGQNFSFLSAETQNVEQFAGAFVGRSVIGAVIGGAASVSAGGSFGEGAKNGAITAGIAFTTNDALHGVGYLRNKIGGFLKNAGSATKTVIAKAKSALSVAWNSDQTYSSRASRLVAGVGTVVTGGAIAAGATTAGAAVGGSVLLMTGMFMAIDAGIDLSGSNALGANQAAFESLGMPGGKALDTVLDAYGVVSGSFGSLWKGVDRAANAYNLLNDVKQ